MSDPRRPLWWTLKLVALLASILSLLLIYLPDFPLFGRAFYPLHFRPLIEKHAKANGLDPLFVAAVIRQESGFRPTARSKVGARGLMQLMPKTARWASQELGIKNYADDRLEDPAFNIQLGCWYLARLFRQFHDPAKVLAAYNGGEGNVQYWATLQGEHLRHAYPETQNYVSQGLRAYQRYKALYQTEAARIAPPAPRVLR